MLADHQEKASDTGGRPTYKKKEKDAEIMQQVRHDLLQPADGQHISLGASPFARKVRQKGAKGEA